MWNTHNDNDILVFALLWEPLGGPTPENVATAFPIECPVFNHRLRGAARRQLSRLQDGTTSSGIIYALSAFAPAQVRHRE